MISFSEFIAEAFAVGKDTDYPPYLNKFVLIFNPKDGKAYKETSDKTHGEASHAIKHLLEFDFNYVKNICNNYISDLKTYFQNNPDEFVAIYKKSGSFEDKRDWKTANVNTILATFDMINDKQMTSQTLIEPEKLAEKYIKSITNKYVDIITNKINNAITLKGQDNEVVNIINSSDIIKVSESSKRVYILDLTDNSIIIMTAGSVNTLYKFGKQAKTKKDVIKNFIDKFYVEKYEKTFLSYIGK